MEDLKASEVIPMYGQVCKLHCFNFSVGFCSDVAGIWKTTTDEK